MTRKNKLENTIEQANPHTIKKFELIEKYTETWAMKLLNHKKCNGIVFIDCMCNSGIYNDSQGNRIVGTPIRISKLLNDIMQRFPNKHAHLYFNDLSEEKISTLQKYLPECSPNFQISTNAIDGNELLRRIKIKDSYNYLLVYDPYVATINWEALKPYINSWGEVILNHMVSDIVRGLPQAKRPNVISKYQDTYKSSLNELIGYNGNIKDLEQKIRTIVLDLRNTPEKEYFISSFPFFNSVNTLVYNLIHCSGNIHGFELFKKTAWKTFEGQSSMKNSFDGGRPLQLDLLSETDNVIMPCDEFCYSIQDIAQFIYDEFKGKSDVPFDVVFDKLKTHPIFPSEGFRPEIKAHLKSAYKVVITRNSMTFR